MANLDNINDVVLEYAEKYASQFAAEAREQKVVKTGRLARSFKATVSRVEGKLRIQIFGEFYGPFQSFGVGPAVTPMQVPDGVNPRPLNGTTYEFKKPNRYITARPFMQTAVDNVTPDFQRALEEAGVKDVEEFFGELGMIKLS